MSTALRAFAPLARRIADRRPEPIKEERTEEAAAPADGGIAQPRDLPTWISAQELAQALDVTRQRAQQILAPLKGAFSRRRPGRGHADEFLRTRLPAELQRRIERYYIWSGLALEQPDDEARRRLLSPCCQGLVIPE